MAESRYFIRLKSKSDVIWYPGMPANIRLVQYGSAPWFSARYCSISWAEPANCFMSPCSSTLPESTGLKYASDISANRARHSAYGRYFLMFFPFSVGVFSVFMRLWGICAFRGAVGYRFSSIKSVIMVKRWSEVIPPLMLWFLSAYVIWRNGRLCDTSRDEKRIAFW